MRKQHDPRLRTRKPGRRQGAMRVFHVSHIERRLVVYEVKARTVTEALEKAAEDVGEVIDQREISDQGPVVKEVKGR